MVSSACRLRIRPDRASCDVATHRTQFATAPYAAPTRRLTADSRIQRAVTLCARQRKSPNTFVLGLSLHEEPGSDLLWHGNRPHYHRRRAFSLPSSEWDRGVPARYFTQANR